MGKFKTIIERRAYENGPHEDVFSELKSIIEKYGMEGIFINFTNTDKLGINPNNEYNTPTGVYCYPIRIVYDQVMYPDPNQLGIKVPFAWSMKFINVFKAKNMNNVLILSKYNSAKWDEDIDKIKRDMAKNIEDSSRMNKIINDDINNAVKDASVQTVGGRFWNVTRWLSKTYRTYNSSKYPNVVNNWTMIFRKILGYSGVYDNEGKGIIHPAEPLQAVFFDVSSLQRIARVANRKKRLEAGSNEVQRIKDASMKVKAVYEINRALRKVGHDLVGIYANKKYYSLTDFEYFKREPTALSYKFPSYSDLMGAVNKSGTWKELLTNKKIMHKKIEVKLYFEDQLPSGWKLERMKLGSSIIINVSDLRKYADEEKK